MFKTILFLTVVFCNVNVFAQSLLPYVYLTFENEDTSTSVTINFMTDKKSANSYAYYATESAEGEPDAYNYKIPSRVGEINNINRSYHHVQLRSLTPNSTYYFVVGDEKIGFSQEYKFRTLPNDHTPIKILTGGDMSTGDKVNKVPEYAMTKEPHVILIGGDIAYANGKTKELKRWDQWFDNMMKVMISPDGFLTPLIVAIGNHEVTTGIALPWGQAPFYEQIFAQENGKTFFTRNLGKNATLLVLDSGHMKTHSQQNDFIEDQLLIHKDTPHRLALYHAPLYPNHRDEFDALANAGKNNWLSLFDKHQLTSAFENHDHTLKRTHILKENSIADKGTVYVGDGCWGKNGRKSNPQKWYLQKAESSAHVWSVYIDKDYLEYEASGENAVIYDHFRLSNTKVKTSIEELM